jgi:hypothetical protein
MSMEKLHTMLEIAQERMARRSSLLSEPDAIRRLDSRMAHTEREHSPAERGQRFLGLARGDPFKVSASAPPRFISQCLVQAIVEYEDIRDEFDGQFTNLPQGRAAENL